MIPTTLKRAYTPALLCLLPATITVLMIVPLAQTALGALVTIGVSCGGLVLFADMARGWGKAKQEALFAEWGGEPSTVLLRHRDNRLNPILKIRYYNFLARKIAENIPAAQEEVANTKRADDIYAAGTTWLRKNTGDTAKVTLLFKGNITYGCRRNLYGVKRIGIGITVVAIVVTLYRAGVMKWSTVPSISQEQGMALASCVAWLAFWIFAVTRNWVKAAAFTYGRALLETCDQFNDDSGKLAT